MTGDSPPAGSEEFGTPFCLDEREVGDTWILGIGAEKVLLVVGKAEYGVAYTQDGKNACGAVDAKGEGVDGEVTAGCGVKEWNPDEITKGEHEAKTVGCGVDLGEDGGFKPKAIENVKGLECGRKEHTV